MQMFSYTKATNISEAILAASGASTAQQGAEIRFIAGGTTLFDLMKLNVERPHTVIDINKLKLDNIEKLASGGLKIGALVRNSDCAHHETVLADYSLLSQAILAGASGQLRNKASMSGNLLQRTRCMYFRNDAMPCNKRLPGSGCGALEGENRSLAILGTSTYCIATNPSDMNVALSALEAVIHITGPQGSREVLIDDFFMLPGSTPERENILEPGDLITAISLPAPRQKSAQVYLKLRDRASYEFALCSTGIIVERVKNKLSFIRIALGGVGTKPWRAYEAEEVLASKAIDDEKILHQAAEAALSAAKPQSQNGFKIELSKRCMIHALKLALKQA